MKEHLIKRLMVPKDILIIRKQGFLYERLDLETLPDSEFDHLNSCIRNLRANRREPDAQENGHFYRPDDERIEYILCREGGAIAFELLNQERSQK